MTQQMVIHLKDFAKVGAAAGANVVAAAAKAAVEPEVQQQVTAPVENMFLHNTLTVVQIIVGLVTVAYVGLKLYRLWRNKKATS
jgi:hypothetical protein